jgi:hypothetical protein
LREARPSFLKKTLAARESKKLFLTWVMGVCSVMAPALDSKSFFASFCSQKEVLSYGFSFALF